MADYYDISGWDELKYYGTGGTRDKSVVENPEDRSLYYFKTSLKKKAIDYKYEFWSEIIASEIGYTLGFNILRYDVARKDDRLGCLSKSMIDPQNEELQEGYKWLTGFDSGYDIKDDKAYTFQLINRLLTKQFAKEGFIRDMIEIIVFDSIIGNEDRHQENWSIIVTTTKQANKDNIFRKRKAVTESSYRFAPIYDSGSSMGRELTDEKVAIMLADNIRLDAYVRRGRSEIHWEGERNKQKHLELIRKVSSFGYKSIVSDIIGSIRARYKEGDIENIINNIDSCLPEGLRTEKIPQVRKDFLIKLVSLRIENLFGIQL